jgi:HEAT repeat protein
VTLAKRLRAPKVAERLTAMAEIAERGAADHDSLQALVESLGDVRKVVQRRAAETCGALERRGIHVRPALVATLDSDTARQRWGAAYALSLTGTPPAEALPVLFEALGVDDGDVRWAAATVLVRMRGEASLIDALCLLVSRGNDAQRKMAAYCLRDLDARSARVEAALHSALDDSDSGVRLAAMSALSHLSADRAATARVLVRLFDDSDERVRRAAAAVLGSLGDRSAEVLAALRAAANNTDLSLQRAARHSLRLLGAGPV